VSIEPTDGLPAANRRGYQALNKNVERTINASLTARELAPGTWCLSGGAPEGIDIILRGADPEARAGLTGIRANKAVVEWRGAGALVTLSTAGGTTQIHARTVILHEPKTMLYEGLPLAKFDDAARRFWRRVFWLVRIPGGRRLLGLVARRSVSSK
jgi:hypothetical protein